MSFIQMIVPVNGSHTGYFYNQQVSKSVSDSSISVALRFLLGQAISMNYLGRLFGGRVVDWSPTKCPVFISNYRTQLQDYIVEVVNRVKDEGMSEEERTYYLDIFKSISDLLTDRESGYIRHADKLIAFLYPEDDTVTPIPCTRNFVEPYLKYLEACSHSDIKADFTIDHIVSVPQFFYNGNIIIEEDIPVGTQYNYSYVGTRHFTEHPHSLGEASIYSYLRGYNWATSNSNGVIGLLATYGMLMLDMSNVEPLSNLRAFYDVHRLMSLKPSTSSDVVYTLAYEPVLHFLVDIFYRFKIKVIDRTVLAILVNHTNPDGQLLRDYLLAERKEEVSAEAYEAFKRSTLRDLVGCDMNIIDDSYSTTSLDAAVAPLLVDAKPKKNEEGEEDQPQEDPEESKEDVSKDPKEGEPESTSTDSTDVDDQSMDQADDKTDDEEEKGVSDDTPEDTDSKDEDQNVEESDDNNNRVHTQSVPKPKLPGLNLKQGINMELASDDEDIDTFLYRKEVESFIDNVLANPNHLSVQQQEALRIIKMQFLYTLNVQSLYNLLKKTVA